MLLFFILSPFIYLFIFLFFSFIHFSFWIHFCSILLHLFPLLTFFVSFVSWFQLVHLHFIISNVVIPTGLKILREEHLDHLKYRENSVAFVLLLCQLQFYGLVNVAGFGWRLNYLSFNGRFHPLSKEMTSPLSSLFDIIINHYRRLLHHRHCRQQDNHHNQCNRCQPFS